VHSSYFALEGRRLAGSKKGGRKRGGGGGLSTEGKRVVAQENVRGKKTEKRGMVNTVRTTRTP